MNLLETALRRTAADLGRYGFKLLARDDETRPQDLADLRALWAVATEADMIAARDAARLISERGFDRDRDLLAAPDDLTAS